MGCKHSTGRHVVPEQTNATTVRSAIEVLPTIPHFVVRFINTPCLQQNSLKFLKKLQNKSNSAYDTLIRQLNVL